MIKDKFITFGLIVILLLNLADLIADIQLNVPLWHILSEGAIVLVSGFMAAYLIIEMRHRTRSLKHLSQQLKDSQRQQTQLSEQFKAARHDYAKAIERQFNIWQLSMSEQEVALLILKGLSIPEIAIMRSTKEKTVRHQASAIYRKAQIDGRHELSAWFMEDFIAAKAA
jgi:DNA-binding NarL/FixJ family response regulator